MEIKRAITYTLVILAMVFLAAGCAWGTESAEKAGLIRQVENPETGEVFWVLTDKGTEWVGKASTTGGGILSRFVGVDLSPIIESLLMLGLGAVGVKPTAAAFRKVKKAANGNANATP